MWWNQERVAELSKKIIKECIVEIDNKPIHILNSDGEVENKHKNCLISKSNKKDKSENNEIDIEERDIKLIMDKTNLNRERAIKELQKNDIVTVLMNYIE